MCGIMGYVGSKRAWPIVLSGLKRLEYRGYDSAGIAVTAGDGIEVRKQVGPLHRLEERNPDGLTGTTGIGHTRWATHGEVTLANCHPHADTSGQLVLVHNGIIDNAEELRDSLDAGARIDSQTDTAILAELIATRYDGDLLQAVRAALEMVQGTAAIAVMHRDHPGELVVARQGSPVVVGLQDDAAFVASDAQALATLTDRLIILHDSDIARLTPGNVEIIDVLNRARERRVEALAIVPDDANLGDHPHYFLKEAREQPGVIRRALKGRLDPSMRTARLPELDALEIERSMARVSIFGCGSSKLAGDVGRYLIERYARISASSDDAAELAMLNPATDHETLHLALSQSGETADVLVFMRELALRDAPMLSITNVVGNSMARAAAANVYMHAGAEYSVAATKSFISQLVCLNLLALRWARQRGMSPSQGRAWMEALEQLPEQIDAMLEHHQRIKALAREHCDASYVMFIGRGVSLPIAREGALKLKELSYIPSEGLSGAQMKHGPIALIEEGSPVWVIAPPDHTRERMLGNIHELKARGATILAIAGHDDAEIAKLSSAHIPLPPHHPALSPLLSVIPLQLFAYEVAVALGREVDRPRNLAKSVTVE